MIWALLVLVTLLMAAWMVQIDAQERARERAFVEALKKREKKNEES